MDLKSSREAETTSPYGKLVFKINNDGFCYPGRRTDIDGKLFPRTIRHVRFQSRKRKWKIRIQRGRNVGHADAETQPAGQQQHEWPIGIQFTKLHGHRKRLSQSAQLR